MLMAYGLVDEEGITYLDREKTFCGKDVRAGILKKKEHGNHLNFSELKLEEQIEYAKRLSEMIKCETVSKEGSYDDTEFKKLRNVMENLFPNIHKSAEKMTFSEIL